MLKVLSLYDYTGDALRPWATHGYQCYAYDIQHKPNSMADPIELQHADVESFKSGGNIFFIHADLHEVDILQTIVDHHKECTVFLSAFPVCTDLAVSGARHFAKKRNDNPYFQDTAATHAIRCGEVGDMIGCPWFVENPVSVLSTLWRKPDYIFHPYEYGGYLAEDDTHPRWPEYIIPRDAYSKRTCLWTGGGFTMPEPRPVDCKTFGRSPQWGKLGGKSLKTKNIRSATPRGFIKAVCSQRIR